jgi:integrase
MASVFKPAGFDRYVIVYRDENNRRRKKTGTKDKAVTERIARGLENKVALRREGLIDPRQEAYADHEAQTLLFHVDAWKETLKAKGASRQHVKLHTSRAMRVIALSKGANLADIEPKKPATDKGVAEAEAKLRSVVATARISDLTCEGVQRSLALLISKGRSLETANHHRNAAKAFAKWLYDTNRARENLLRAVAGFNAKEDPRHERRTISLEEIRRLIEAAESGPTFKSMTGPMRALCYRLAVASGLRYSELASITPESFAWQAGAITIRAAYAKNGVTATLPLPGDLMSDLARYVATLPAGKPIFPLPHDKGAAMLKEDLKRAKIQYRDSAGRVFDFHSLRCQCATLADAAGISPRVVQRMMRHSKLEMTGRYTRPRAVDLENAAKALPSLKTQAPQREALAASGTDGRDPGATTGATDNGDDRPNVLRLQNIGDGDRRQVNPLVVGSSPTPVTCDGELEPRFRSSGGC